MPVNAGAIEQHHANIEILTAAQKLADRAYDRKAEVTLHNLARTMTNQEIGAEIDREYATIRDLGKPTA